MESAYRGWVVDDTITTHVSKKCDFLNTLWVKWVNMYIIKDRSLWGIPIDENASWGWMKMMELRNEVRKHIWRCLVDGQNTNAWHDLWCKNGPLSNFITRRQVYSAGFLNNASVASVVDNGQLTFPDEWYVQHSALLPNRQLDLINGERGHGKMEK